MLQFPLPPDRAARVLAQAVLRVYGGRGSGNFGHAGRKGQIGGSASGGSASSKMGKSSTSGESRSITDLRQKLDTTTLPSLTAFVLPDGTRLEKPAYQTHARAVSGQKNFDPDPFDDEKRARALYQVMDDGVVRYNPDEGIEVSAPLTQEQAELIADDFEGKAILVDVHRRNSSSSGLSDRIASKGFNEGRFTADTLRNWINQQIKESRALGGAGSGHHGHAGVKGQLGGSAPGKGGAATLDRDSLPPEAVEPGLFDLNQIGKRRFLYNPKTDRILLGKELRPKSGESASGEPEESHAEVVAALGISPRGYDAYTIRGDFSNGKVAVSFIHALDMVDRSDTLHALYDKLLRNGATKNTKVDVGWGPVLPLGERLKTLRSASLILQTLGGSGSGHHGHAGVKGQLGGSAPGKNKAIQNLVTRLTETHSPEATDFILPDGRRLAGSSVGHQRRRPTHADAVGGPQALQDAMQAGVVRYASGAGVEVSAPITDEQAEIIAADFFNSTFYVDVLDWGTHETRHKMFSPETSPNIISGWIRYQLETKNRTLGGPVLPLGERLKTLRSASLILQTLGGAGSGHHGHTGVKGQLGGSAPGTGSSLAIRLRGVEKLTADRTLWHSSPDPNVPSFSAFFGGSEFVETFGTNEFGQYRFEAVLPKGTKVIDLNKKTPATREFMARVVEHAWSDDKAHAEKIRKHGGNYDDFYEAWTDKKNIVGALKDMPGTVAIYQDEWLVPKDVLYNIAIRRLGGAGSGNFGHAGRPGQIGGSSTIGGSLTARVATKLEAAKHLATELVNKSWFHGSSGPLEGGLLRDPVFATSDAKSADWFSENRGPAAHDKQGRGQIIYQLQTSVETPFELKNYDDAALLKDIIEQSSGIRINLTNDPKYGWSWEAPIVSDYSPYDGYNPIDVMYVPAVRDALKKAGFDALYSRHDELVGGETDALVVTDRNKLRGKFGALGGAGSGNFGHAGRPGQIGGSARGVWESMSQQEQRRILALKDEIQERLHEPDPWDTNFPEVIAEAKREGVLKVYHGTASSAIDSIAEKGLIPKGGKGADTWAQREFDNEKLRTQRMIDTAIAGRQASVFVSPDVLDAVQYADYATEVNPGTKSVVLEVTVPATELDRFKLDELSTAMRFEGTFKPEWIRVSEDVTGFKPLPKKSNKLKAAAAAEDGTLRLYMVLLVDEESTRAAARKPAILATADSYVPKVSVAFRYAFAMGRKTAKRVAKNEHTSVSLITRRIEESVRGALETTLIPTLMAMHAAGGEIGAKSLGKFRAADDRDSDDNDDLVRFTFGVASSTEWARKHAAELVTNVSKTTRRRIRTAIVGHVEGDSWTSTLEKIVNAVGDEERAETIAHHETMLAVSEGQREAWDQAVEQGFLSGNEERVWIVTPDERLCPICEALDGQTAGLDEQYDGEYDGPPAHVGCRCTEGIQGIRSAYGTSTSGNYGHAGGVGGPGNPGGSTTAGFTPATPEQRKALGIPPAWTDVIVNPDPNGAMLARGKDSKGRNQYRYSVDHTSESDAAKFERMKAFDEELPQLRKQIEKDLTSGDKETRETAAALLLIDKTGFRVGSDRDTLADKQAYGTTTLRARHVKVEGDKVRFAFTAKKGVDIRKTVKDPQLATVMRQQLAGKERRERLFSIRDRHVRAYMETHAPAFTPKDFRTRHATALALSLVNEGRVPRTQQEFKKARRMVGQRVAKFLGNTHIVALKSYIDPTVFARWERP